MENFRMSPSVDEINELDLNTDFNQLCNIVEGKLPFDDATWNKLIIRNGLEDSYLPFEDCIEESLNEAYRDGAKSNEQAVAMAAVKMKRAYRKISMSKSDNFEKFGDSSIISVLNDKVIIADSFDDIDAGDEDELLGGDYSYDSDRSVKEFNRILSMFYDDLNDFLDMDLYEAYAGLDENVLQDTVDKLNKILRSVKIGINSNK